MLAKKEPACAVSVCVVPQRGGAWVPHEAEAWPIIEREPERIPLIPPDLMSVTRVTPIGLSDMTRYS